MMKDNKFIYEVSYIDTRGRLVETEIEATNTSHAYDLASEDYYFSSRGLFILQLYEIS